VVGAGTLFCWAIWVAPSKFQDEVFRRRFKFLFLKFRPSVYWWSSVFLLLTFVLNLTFVILVAPPFQLQMLTSVNSVYQILVSLMMPYRTYHANCLEMGAGFALTMTATAMMWFADRENGYYDNNFILYMVLSTFVPIVLAVLFAVHLIGSTFNVGGLSTSRLDKEGMQSIRQSMDRALSMSEDEWSELYGRLSELDKIDMRTFERILRAESDMGLVPWIRSKARLVSSVSRISDKTSCSAQVSV